MTYKIVSDSAANLLKLKSDIPYARVPLTISTAEREFVDDESLDIKDMLHYLKAYKGKSGSACPSVAAWLEAFGDAENVFAVAITSGLSGSYNSACVAKEEYETTHPGRKVHVIDTLSAGAEMSLVIEKIEELIQQGKTFEAICEEVRIYREHTGLLFSLESLKNLANNGRVSPVIARLAGTLGICVVGKASEQGTLEQLSKCRGEKKALLTLYKYMKDLGYAGGKVRIDHCLNEKAAEQLKSMILEEYPGAGVEVDITRGLCSFYAEIEGMLIGFEKG